MLTNIGELMLKLSLSQLSVASTLVTLCWHQRHIVNQPFNIILCVDLV